MTDPKIKAAPCLKCGMVPEITAEKKPKNRCELYNGEIDYSVKTNPDCPVCSQLTKSGWMALCGGVNNVIELKTKTWNYIMPVLARVVSLNDAGKLAPIQSCGCGAMTLALPSTDSLLTRLNRDLDEDDAIALAGIADDVAFTDKLFNLFATARCSILDDRCPRDVRSKGSVKNMKCCLPAYAGSHPADKMDDETLSAITGLTSCLNCDCLGKHWYLSECDQCNCGSVDAHLKCYYLAAEYRKRLESKKDLAQ